ncbi:MULTISPECIES: hypothetical protein [Micromonospora]|uniref:Uncharacterized protein n=1 Tax=Micromonospora fiedleri TaxID=1157498 RepID=A0ABS1UPQ8_9ACTN|nr:MULTISPECIES: hypothetical protein [Micromonospora]AEB46037.1 hypothetical protein VAB18032_24695 [Micromonospora maris AB-18-032]MBL6278332.1 hypothetical protein [Micromonospora fiedleri]WSK41421.1 hypothetical protein OG712_23320 [Micromonospora maris]
MKGITDLELSAEKPATMIAANGNYALVAGKGNIARLRTSPQSTMLSAESAAALMAPLS